MEDGKVPDQPDNQGSEESVEAKARPTLLDATHLLKKEALRRYSARHRGHDDAEETGAAAGGDQDAGEDDTAVREGEGHSELPHGGHGSSQVQEGHGQEEADQDAEKDQARDADGGEGREDKLVTEESIVAAAADDDGTDDGAAAAGAGKDDAKDEAGDAELPQQLSGDSDAEQKQALEAGDSEPLAVGQEQGQGQEQIKEENQGQEQSEEDSQGQVQEQTKEENLGEGEGQDGSKKDNLDQGQSQEETKEGSQVEGQGQEQTKEGNQGESQAQDQTIGEGQGEGNEDTSIIKDSDVEAATTAESLKESNAAEGDGQVDDTDTKDLAETDTKVDSTEVTEGAVEKAEYGDQGQGQTDEDQTRQEQGQGQGLQEDTSRPEPQGGSGAEPTAWKSTESGQAEKAGGQAEEGQGQAEGQGQKVAKGQGEKDDAAIDGGERENVEKQANVAVDGMGPDTRGDEDEISAEMLTDNDKPKIPDDHFYNFDEHVSKAVISDESGLPADLLQLHHSFGYDCRKRSNLHVLDMDTVLFAAGNVVQLLNLQTKEQIYIRSTSGGGIGAIAVHPTKKYFAVGEKGTAPNINIYEYPSLKLYRIMRGGTEKSYAHVDFNPNGSLLASVGGDPDFMLTLWDWRQETIVLRSKAFSQDVFRVTFSTELQGQLTSSGTGHIRFWKMAKTFTGLKLQGQLGKFGKKEISDIEGYVELPDGKVLSGSEWGNMLLWDGGLIKVEISRKNRKPCHVGPIQQIIMDEGELMTVGADGYIRVWDFETIDTADVTDESEMFEMEAMNELKVGNDVSLRSIVKSGDPENPTMWYAQDSHGAVWKLDLSFSFTSLVPERIMKYHAGPIQGCSASPSSHLVATIGIDCSVRVSDYMSKTQLCAAKYNTSGTTILWVPSMVDPKGATILAGFHDGVVRALNFQKSEATDVHGRKQKEQCELALKQAFKPHNSQVTALAIDNRGEILATGGSDATVFFLSVGDNYEPIGFIKVPSSVTHLEWSPSSHSSSTLLVCCVEGQVLEVQSPDDGNFDTSHSYEISGLKTRSHQFKSVKSQLRHEEEVAKKSREEDDRRKKEADERRIRIERGLETASEQGDEDEEEEEKKEEDWSPYIPEEPSPILYGFHAKEEGKVWISMGEFDSGYLYEVEFLEEEQKANVAEDKLYEPTRTIPVHDSGDTPIQCLKFSSQGKHLIMGLQDGSIRIQPLRNEDVGLMGPYWSLNMHDNDTGRISHLATSYDDKFLFSVGDDGNFFTFKIMDREKVEQKMLEAKAKIPSAKPELAEKRIDDIQDPKSYSIEDAKQKAEYDKMMRLADEKKRSVRTTINQLRNQFKKLLVKNNELPQHLRLDRKEFEMDPEIKRQLRRQTEEKIEMVTKEMAWEEEKHRLALEKTRSRFKDVVECERIVVKAFLTQHEVCSFRASKLTSDFYLAKAEMERRKTIYLSKDEASRQATEMMKAQRQATDAQLKGEEGQGESDTRITTTLKGSMGERIAKSLAKVEEKKKKRAARKAQSKWDRISEAIRNNELKKVMRFDRNNKPPSSQWNRISDAIQNSEYKKAVRCYRKEQWGELYGGKPDDNYEDPADLAAIKDAQENMGDYKLKSADDYVVPDHLRMNTEKARARLIILKEMIHKHKYDFNQNLLGLRDKKIQVIDEIRDLVTHLDRVQTKLGAEHSRDLPEVPRMHPEELPEKKYEYTRESLLRFKEELVVKRQQAAKPVESDGGFGGFGAGGAGAAPTSLASNATDSFARHASPTPTAATGAGHKQASVLTSEKTMEPDWTAQKHDLTPLERKLKQAEEIRLLYEQDRLFRRIDEILKNFDAELRCLRHDRFKLDIDFKNADLRQVTLFEELLLLKDFEKQENILSDKVDGKQQEKLDMQAKVIEVQQKLDQKKKDIEKLQEKEKALHATFVASLGDNNKFGDYLTKVFKKKIKRSRKKATEGEGSGDESDEDSSDESDWSESDEDEESEAGGYDLDVCPPGCDQNMYDNTCTLREKRLDIEEELAEEKKNRDALNKELEALQKKAKVIDMALKNAEMELEAFQLEKQRKLNELDVVVTLKLHQIQYMVNGLLAQDLSPTLVFEAMGVVRLQHRIKELEHEKTLQKKQQKEAKKKHVQLIKDRRHFEQRIGEMDEQCNKMMLQKFGRIVNLEELETVTVNRQLEELKEKLRQNELQCSNELAGWDERIMESKDAITDLIRENTKRLDQLNMLLGEKKMCETELDSRQKNLGSEFSGARKSDIHERQRLIQLVHLQAQEVDALKEEIMLLSRKGGHILPPAQPPMPQSAQGPRNMNNP